VILRTRLRINWLWTSLSTHQEREVRKLYPSSLPEPELTAQVCAEWGGKGGTNQIPPRSCDLGGVTKILSYKSLFYVCLTIV